MKQSVRLIRKLEEHLGIIRVIRKSRSDVQLFPTICIYIQPLPRPTDLIHLHKVVGRIGVIAVAIVDQQHVAFQAARYEEVEVTVSVVIVWA